MNEAASLVNEENVKNMIVGYKLFSGSCMVLILLITSKIVLNITIFFSTDFIFV